MNKKQLQMVRFLSDQKKPVTSSEIANVLRLSSRSIKNYVHEINGLYGKKIILSSHNGYELAQKANSLFLNNHEDKIPQTLEERSFYILKQLFLNHTTPLDLFDLCDYLCVSYSTIKSVIAKMNKTFQAYHIEFTCENDAIRIEGNEKDKRKLIRYVINEEAKISYINTTLLKDHFKDIDVERLQQIVCLVFKKHNYYLNDFALINLLLHLLIIIDRKTNGNELNSGRSDFTIVNEQEVSFLADLIYQLETAFLLKINLYEYFEIYMLFKSNTNLSLDNSSSDLKSVVGEELLRLTDDYVKKINHLYKIDLSSQSFKTPFVLHLKNLLFRTKSGQFIANPMSKTIKTNNPIIFDIAIFISLDLMERYNITINEDEASFLAMHIGSEMERQNDNNYKVPAILVCPEYHGFASQIGNSLMFNFGTQLHLLCCVNDEESLVEVIQRHSTALVFTTIPLNIHASFSDISIVSIAPMDLLSQGDAIRNAILKNQESYKNKKLMINFHNFFEDDLFLVISEPLSKEQVIGKLCSELLEKKYVDVDFEEKVYRRENAAGTAFGSVAIPHSVEMDAVKTSIAVAISKRGISWDSGVVSIVFLLAINKADKQSFHNLYESLITLFSEDTLVQKVKSCQSLSEFKYLIYDTIDMNDNY